MPVIPIAITTICIIRAYGGPDKWIVLIWLNIEVSVTVCQVQVNPQLKTIAKRHVWFCVIQNSMYAWRSCRIKLSSFVFGLDQI